MSQSTDMDRLTKDLRRAAHAREATLAKMRQFVKSELAACAATRGKRAQDYRAQARKFLSALAKDVAAHRHAMARQIIRTQEFLASTAKDVAAHRNATMNQIARLGSGRLKAQSQLRSDLQRQCGKLVKDTRQFRDAVARALEQTARRQHAMLAAHREKLRKEIAGFVAATHEDRMKARDIWGAFRVKRAS